MIVIENKLISWIEKHIIYIFLIVITLISLVIRLIFINFQSDDYIYSLLPWFEQLKEGGGLAALKLDIGDYNAPYLTFMALTTYLPFNPLYMIKAFSIIFDYVLAFASYLLVNEFTGRRSIKGVFAYAIVVLLPTVVTNSSVWGQCDSIYTALLLFSLYFLLKEKNLYSFIFFGLAFSFKLQSVFLLPLFIFVYFIKKNFSVLTFIGSVIITNIVVAIPSLIAGKSPFALITIYLKQVAHYNELTLNMANIYMLLPWASGISKLVTGIFILGMALVLLYIVYSQIRPDNQTLVTLALWSVMWAVFLLPHMHERYLFLGDILSLIWVLVHKKKYYILGCVQLISFFSYCPFLFGNGNVNLQYTSMLYLFLITDLTIELLRQLGACTSRNLNGGYHAKIRK